MYGVLPRALASMRARAFVHVTFLQAAEEMWGKTLVTSFAYWAPIPHTLRRLPIRSWHAANHARAVTCVARPISIVLTGSGANGVNRSHLSLYLVRQVSRVRELFVVQATLSLHWILASIDPFEGIADCRVDKQKPATTVEKLLLGTPRGLKFS